MITDEMIQRINELYRKSQAEGLTEAELSEQKELRAAYVAAIKASMRSNLESITIQEPDGTLVNVKQRHDEKYGIKNETDHSKEN